MLEFTLLLAVGCFATPLQAEPDAALPLTHRIEEGRHTFTVAGEETPFAVLRLDGRVPYVWPLRGPGGAEVTRAFPMEKGRPQEVDDHPHHRSFWFTHGAVDGHDFWHDPECRIELDGTPEVTLTEGLLQTQITLPLVWKAPGRPALLYEKRTYRFSAGRDLRLVQFESTLTAPSAESDPDGVLIGDTKEGTFGMRLRPELRLKGPVAAATIFNSEGQVDGDCWGQRAQWVTYDAPLVDHRVSVTLMDHTKNLRHPTWWHARDYGLVAANPFGAHGLGGAEAGAGDYRLEPGRSLTQRYLVVLAKGEGDRAMPLPAIAAVYRWWVLLRRDGAAALGPVR